MTINELKKLIPTLNKNNVLSLKSNKSGFEVVFKDVKISSVTVTAKDGKTITASGPEPTQSTQLNLPIEPIQTIRSKDAPVPTDSLEVEEGMSFDKLLNWSVNQDDEGVPGANDGLLNDQPLDERKTAFSAGGL